MSEFTKGPWGIERTRTHNWIGPLRPDGKVDEIVTSNDRGNDLKLSYVMTNDANAHLIAAAPELYEAIKLLTDAGRWVGDEWVPDDEAWKKASKALAKAKGKA